MDFIKTISSSQVGGAIPPVTCKLNASLGGVIHSLASKSIHRIHVVGNDENEVVGVITLRDVISCFVYEPPNISDHYFGFPAKEMLNG